MLPNLLLYARPFSYFVAGNFGIQRSAASHQIPAKTLNRELRQTGAKLQAQPYDHVLRDEERDRDAVEEVTDYITQNPERAGLMGEGCFDDYEFTGCLVPGYPHLSPFQFGYWEEFWQMYSRLRENGLIRK